MFRGGQGGSVLGYLARYGASRRRTIKSCENARNGLSRAFRNFVSEKQDVRGGRTRERGALASL